MPNRSARCLAAALAALFLIAPERVALAEPLKIAPVIRDAFECEFELEDSFGVVHRQAVTACADRQPLDPCSSSSTASLCTSGSIEPQAVFAVNGREIVARANFNYTHAIWLEPIPGHLAGAKQYVCDSLSMLVRTPGEPDDEVTNFCEMAMTKGWHKAPVTAEGIPSLVLKAFKRNLEFPDHRYGFLKFTCSKALSERDLACPTP
jgi:hypothetical protein